MELRESRYPIEDALADCVLTLAELRKRVTNPEMRIHITAALHGATLALALFNPAHDEPLRSET